SIVGMGSNISENQILNQIDLLNRYFANEWGGRSSVNTGIQFCLAKVGPDSNGIIRYSNYNTDHNIESYQSFLSINTEYAQDKFLHIFTCNNIKTDSAVRGYSSTIGEPKQGVVIEYNRFGSYNATVTSINVQTSSKGKVLVHEVGHFLGLLHTFEG